MVPDHLQIASLFMVELQILEEVPLDLSLGYVLCVNV